MVDEETRPSVQTSADQAMSLSDSDDLTQERFLKAMLGAMSSTLQDVVGAEQASGYFASVGTVIAEWLNQAYHAKIGVDDFDIEQLAQVFVDLQRRIDSGFTVRSIEPDRIVLTNTQCPFGNEILGRSSMCVVTSNIFGRIAAENCGYARVTLQRTLADGQGACDVVISFGQTGRVGANTNEYFKVADLPDGDEG